MLWAVLRLSRFNSASFTTWAADLTLNTVFLLDLILVVVFGDASAPSFSSPPAPAPASFDSCGDGVLLAVGRESTGSTWSGDVASSSVAATASMAFTSRRCFEVLVRRRRRGAGASFTCCTDCCSCCSCCCRRCCCCCSNCCCGFKRRRRRRATRCSTGTTTTPPDVFAFSFASATSPGRSCRRADCDLDDDDTTARLLSVLEATTSSSSSSSFFGMRLVVFTTIRLVTGGAARAAACVRSTAAATLASARSIFPRLLGVAVARLLPFLPPGRGRAGNGASTSMSSRPTSRRSAAVAADKEGVGADEDEGEDEEEEEEVVVVVVVVVVVEEPVAAPVLVDGGLSSWEDEEQTTG
jgi:hypothetical protein